jgi:predicted nucleotidyltransferase
MIIPDAVPPQKRTVVLKAVEALSAVDGVVAVVLGGSYARGTHHAESDIDIGIYYCEQAPFSISEISELAHDLRVQEPVTVTDFYSWGQWVNGGAWIHTAAGKVDFLYRNIDHVECTIAEAGSGIYQQDYNQQPTFGFYSVAYLGETDVCIPLYDPYQRIAELKAKVRVYPPGLRRAIIANELWNAEFCLLFASKFSANSDIYNTTGCLARLASNLTQVLYALNQTYFINDKGALDMLAQFELCPSDYANRIAEMLACPGYNREQLRESVATARRLWQEVVEISSKIHDYKPKFLL